MSRTTPATRLLEDRSAAFTLHPYAYDPGAGAKGLQAAAALGVAPDLVFKTLMLLVDGRPACAMLPSHHVLALKRAAAALGGKAAAMMPPAQAERGTGYRVGGISPFGQRRVVPTLLDESALAYPLIFLNAGQRGLQVRIAPAEVVRVLGCAVAAVTA